MTKDQGVPGRLDRVREFVNTVDFESGNDKLADEKTAASFFAGQGFEHAPAAAELAGIREFREAIRRVLLANSGDGDLDEAWASFVPLASGTPARIVLEPDGSARLASCKTSAAGEAVRAELLGIIYDAIRSGTWRRLKACRKDTCLWAFYDHSKNGSGTWCSMAVCGNRVKAQRRRSRQS